MDLAYQSLTFHTRCSYNNGLVFERCVVQIFVSFMLLLTRFSWFIIHSKCMFGGKCEVEGVGVLVLVLHVERMWGEAGLRHSFTHS
jgi:hypothetical protein